MDNKLDKKRRYALIAGFVFIIFIAILLINKNINNDVTEADKVSSEDNISETENTTQIKNTSDTENTSSVESTSELKSAAETQNTLGAESVNEISEDAKKQIDALVTTYYDTSKAVDSSILAGSNEEDNKQIIESITQKRDGVEEYKDVVTYIRIGLEADSFVVFSTYNIKFNNIDTLAPGMSVLYVINNNGTYVIKDDPDNDALNQYINQLSQEEEIKNIIAEVNTKLTSAIEKDETLKTFITQLKDISESETN
jgi:hypothetical protein